MTGQCIVDQSGDQACKGLVNENAVFIDNSGQSPKYADFKPARYEYDWLRLGVNWFVDKVYVSNQTEYEAALAYAQSVVSDFSVSIKAVGGFEIPLP